MIVTIIRVNGARETHEVARGNAIRDIQELIGAPHGSDSVNLRDGRIMVVDDTGAIDGKPINPEATKLYHAVCIPGTTWEIRGDVAIVWDSDFE